LKICRFNNNRLGVVSGEEVIDVTAALDILPARHYPFPAHDLLVENLAQLMIAAETLVPHGIRHRLNDVKLLSPIANPGKIIAAPVNYAKHLQEVLADPNLHYQNRIDHIQRAGLFLKSNSSLSGPTAGVPITLPSRRTDHEVELVVVIGRQAKNVNANDAQKYIAGYCVGLDMTIRGPEERSLRKSPDSYTVLGPWLTSADEVAHPNNLGLELKVNGRSKQNSNTRDLILNVEALIAFASSFYTLYPGDLIFTGTPEGVGEIVPGDEIEAFIEKLGSIKTRVLPALNDQGAT
jgi:2-keto-4-pentenoate hydratase/2-oxohepta-3-ene-1,7-dioic acid hydratase in catechol pathway